MIPTLHFRWNLVPKTEPHMYDATLQQFWAEIHVPHWTPDRYTKANVPSEWRDIPKHYAT